MNWFIRWIVGGPPLFRKTDHCDEAELALVRDLADLLEKRELDAENPSRRKGLAC